MLTLSMHDMAGITLSKIEVYNDDLPEKKTFYSRNITFSNDKGESETFGLFADTPEGLAFMEYF